MKLLFILDALDSLKTYKDSSLAMMREAAARGHALFVAMPSALFLRHHQVRVQALPFSFSEGARYYQCGAQAEYALSDFNAVLNRKDPPFDSAYLHLTYLLEIAQQQGACVLNNPQAVRDWNEKLAVIHFPQFAPAFLVSAHADLILDFLAEHGDVIIKPLDGMGGAGIFRVQKNDPNIGVIIETSTQFGQTHIMAQRYLPQILQGDKRILIINGKPLDYALARIPKAGETRGNLAAGGTGVAQLLTQKDREIAETIAPVLQQKGLFLVGLDVIGEHLTEINVTSPTGMVEIAAQTIDTHKPCQPATLFVDALEALF